MDVHGKEEEIEGNRRKQKENGGLKYCDDTNQYRISMNYMNRF